MSSNVLRSFLALGLALMWGGSFASSALAESDMTPIPMISGIEMLKEGGVAPDFTLKDLTGAPFTLSQVLQEKKGVLIFFWSIFCEPCKEELPILQELTDAYRDKGVDFVGVILDGQPMKEAVNAFLKQEKHTFRTLIDESNEDESFLVSDPFGVAGTPTLYLLDKNRKVILAVVGRTTKEKLEEAIRKLP